MQIDIKEELSDQGIREDVFSVDVAITPITTTDPEVIAVTYHSLYDVSPYIKNTVKIEISGRSMIEPIERKAVSSVIDAAYPSAPFTSREFEVNSVIPERTFLEKAFLLHEEFRKGAVRVERMSRHIYDIAMMDSKEHIGERAVANEELYRAVIEHRRKFIALKGFDYDELYPATLCMVPNEEIAQQWEKDYQFMCEHMIYGSTPSFPAIIENIKALNNRIRQLNYQKL